MSQPWLLALLKEAKWNPPSWSKLGLPLETNPYPREEPGGVTLSLVGAGFFASGGFERASPSQVVRLCGLLGAQLIEIYWISRKLRWAHVRKKSSKLASVKGHLRGNSPQTYFLRTSQYATTLRDPAKDDKAEGPLFLPVSPKSRNLRSFWEVEAPQSFLCEGNPSFSQRRGGAR